MHTQPQVPAGWYAAEPGTLRYWDGVAWTEHRAPAPQPAPTPVAVAPTPAAPAPIAAPAQMVQPAASPMAQSAPVMQHAPVAAVQAQPVVPVMQYAAVDAAVPVAQPMQVAVPPTPVPQHAPMAVNLGFDALPDLRPREHDIPTDDEPESDEKTHAAAAYAGMFLLSWLAPVIVFFMKKDESPFVRRHTVEIFNHLITVGAAFVVFMVFFVLSEVVGGVVGFAGTMLMLLGWLLMLGVFVGSAVFTLLGAKAAYEGRDFRYPVGIRPIS